ncbi:MAG: rhomboid family intramembrane serine protease [Akkermansiaceae bacterium]|nr:rhomboid family intramembrane serine protease [Verrucomicrobiales bacterium]
MIFILPTGVDYQTRRYPTVTFTIMGICTLLWLVQLILHIANGVEVDEWFLEYLWYTPALSHWWTHLTWMFVHDGFFHLAGNMIYLFLFGACVEDSIGRPRFIALFLLTGLSSELIHVTVTAGHFASEIPLGGASGAISGCIGAFLLLMAKSKIEFKYFIFIFFRFFSGEFFLAAWLVISGWFLMDLLQMFLAGPDAGVAFGAHVGGTLSGILLMLVQKAFPTRFPDEDEEVEEIRMVPPQPAVATARPVEQKRFRIPTPQPVEKPAIYLHIAGAQSGPFTYAQIGQMFATGEIPPEALYWREGMADWSPSAELRQLAS